MLAPCLGDGLEFDVSWITPFLMEIIPNNLHLCQIQGGAAFFRESKQLLIGAITNRKNLNSLTGCRFLRKGWSDLTDCPMLDDVICQQTLSNGLRSGYTICIFIKAQNKTLTGRRTT